MAGRDPAILGYSVHVEVEVVDARIKSGNDESGSGLGPISAHKLGSLFRPTIEIIEKIGFVSPIFLWRFF